MNSHSPVNVTAAGYVVTDRNGDFIAWAEHAEVASKRFRLDPLADRWTQCSTGIVMGYRRKAPKANRFEQPRAA